MRVMHDPKRRFLGVAVTDEIGVRRIVPYSFSGRFSDGTTTGSWLSQEERRAMGVGAWLVVGSVGFVVSVVLAVWLLGLAASSSSALVALSPIALPIVVVGVAFFGMARASSIGGAIGQARYRLAHARCPSCDTPLEGMDSGLAECAKCGGVWGVGSGDED